MNTTGARTQGETRFEQYLQSQHLPFAFEKEYPGKSKRPDYSISWQPKDVILDVKDFDQPADLLGIGGAFDPYIKIREKIHQGKDKFRQFKEHPCGLVLCNLGNPLVDLETSDIMLGTMYGDSGFTFPVDLRTGIGDDTKIKRAFLGRGKMIRPHWKTPSNSTISALITLSKISPHYHRVLDILEANPRKMGISEHWMESERAAELASKEYDPEFVIQRVIVWHNAYARIPFPQNLFRGPYDLNYGAVVEEDGAFQRVTYRGALLPTRIDQ